VFSRSDLSLLIIVKQLLMFSVVSALYTTHYIYYLCQRKELCNYVMLDYSRSYERILIKLFAEVWRSPGSKQLDFGGDLNRNPDIGI